MNSDLPAPLRRLVREAVALLGDVIREEAGPQIYADVEEIRKWMKATRSATSKKTHESLQKAFHLLKRSSKADRLAIAHAFSLMLELMNTCENAYRTYRIRQRPRSIPKKHDSRIVYVFTAHPTEARSAHSISLFRSIQAILIQSFEQGFSDTERDLKYFLKLAWKVPMSNEHRPTVEDEAKHLYSILLREEVLLTLIRFEQERGSLAFRTWVGGDKDGHPHVNDITMRKSFRRSREAFEKFIRSRLECVEEEVRVIESAELEASVEKVSGTLSALSNLRDRDGERLKTFHQEVESLTVQMDKTVGACSPHLEQVQSILKTFPGLVIPLEFRESADKVEEKPIENMIRVLRKISRGGQATWYVRGFVVSQTSSVDDLMRAATVLKRVFGSLVLPIIPLFENRQALRDADKIVNTLLKHPAFIRALETEWENRFEVMLGYSDSAKEIGAFPSRLLIGQAMQRLDRVFRKSKVQGIYFHGTGGSVARGGGSVEEQTEWWPKDARSIFKATIQGEMVQRSFASQEIVMSQLDQLLEKLRTPSQRLGSGQQLALLTKFAGHISSEYQQKIQSSEFLDVVKGATAYPYLEHLRIGSRPSKRGRKLSVTSLRAIPWVLCWTQVRTLFPAWWGTGYAWNEMNLSDRTKLKRMFKDNSFFRSYVKLLGFTLEKVELPIWNMYLENSDLSPKVCREISSLFQKEWNAATRFVREVSGSRNLLWFRPWLKTSIRLRSSMIHALNLLQILAIADEDEALLRETVTGIASGMLTTG